MARAEGASLQSIDEVEDQLKDVIQGLYQVMVQVTQYDNVGGQSSKEVVANELKTLSNALKEIHAVSTASSTRLPHVPTELIQYVENGRNPDIYTREFVEVVRRGNQLMRGKLHAYESFRDVLAGEMRTALPELRDDVDQVVAATTPAPTPAPAGAHANNNTTNNNNNTPSAAAAAQQPAAAARQS